MANIITILGKGFLQLPSKPVISMLTKNNVDLVFRITGVNLTALPGINSHSAFRIISEIGLDMGAWPTEKHFVSWLGLCPGNKVSGGKQLQIFIFFLLYCPISYDAIEKVSVRILI